MSDAATHRRQPWASAKRRIGRLCLWLAIVVGGLFAFGVALAWYQGKRIPTGQPDYVALGSSFAAGAGLGKLQQSSPLLCARSVNGYPQQLARRRGLSIVDMSCGGAVTENVIEGGQFFQGPQIAAITPETRLVTMTIGGNDVGYVGDLSLLAERNEHGILGWLVKMLWSGPKAPDQRGYALLDARLDMALDLISRRAPNALIVVATYPTILPSEGTCPRLGIDADEAAVMRHVGDTLAALTRSVAARHGAVLVDMHRLGVAHNACSTDPWTAGWTNASVAPFHPTLRGAVATADAISAAIR